MRASKLLSTSELKTLEAAIKSAESATSAEVVVCIASRSGRYDRGEDLVGVVVALLCVAGAWLLFQGAHDESSLWALRLVLLRQRLFQLLVSSSQAKPRCMQTLTIGRVLPFKSWASAALALPLEF